MDTNKDMNQHTNIAHSDVQTHTQKNNLTLKISDRRTPVNIQTFIQNNTLVDKHTSTNSDKET